VSITLANIAFCIGSSVHRRLLPGRSRLSCTLNLSFVFIPDATEGSIGNEIHYHEAAGLRVTLFQQADDIRPVVLHAFLTFVFFELGIGRVGLADADRNMMSLSHPVCDPARNYENRGLVGDDSLYWIDLEGMLGIFTSE